MCGIAGIFNFHSATEIEQVRKMTDAIAHRGPDGEGFWQSEDKHLTFGHRRLSIIDLSEKAAQPMHYRQRYTLIFNGEIYNYIELRETLKRKGHTFNTNTDAEVLLAAFDEYKENCLDLLDGMFAFALWDSKTETLFCARDRFGEKPFFYTHQANRSFCFASEMKGLWAAGQPKTLNEKMLFYYLAYNVVENPYNKAETFFKSIYRLEAAHYLLIKKDGSFTKKKYWDIDLNHKSDISLDNAQDKFRELFFQSIERRLRADVPIGSSLSGGIDSSSIVCAIAELKNKQAFTNNTFSARFKNTLLDEGKYLNDVSAITHIQRHEMIVDEQVLLNDLDTMLAHHEEPVVDTSPLAQWSVMKMAKENNVKVLLDGQGADEILGGYLHFFRPYFSELLLHDKNLFNEELALYKKLRGTDFPADGQFRLNARFNKLIRIAGSVRRRLSTPSYLSFINPDLVQAFKNEPPPFETFNNLNESLKYSTTVYGLEKLLRYADRNSMAFSREVRTPFLSHEMVEFVFSLPTVYKMHEGWTKYILRTSMNQFLPTSITWRVDKLGYQPPVNDWLQKAAVKDRIESAKGKLISKRFLNSKTRAVNKEWNLLVAASLF
jgi:asparagine synthase (glutamine-hydrolysing)